MRAKSLILKYAATLAVAGIAVAPLQASQNARPAYTRQVPRGKAVVIYNAYQIGEDCNELRPPIIKIVLPPQHGTATIGRTRHQPSYDASNSRFKCNKLSVPMAIVTYRPKPGYIGTDVVKLHTDLVAPGDTSSTDTSVTLEVK